MALKILLVSLLCLLVNIPMGMMRERARRFFPDKFFWIHALIPLIIVLRIWLDLRPVLLAIFINIAAAVIGQLIGGLLEKKKRRASSPTAS